MDIGPTELIIVLAIVLVIFGVGRVSALGGELGKAIRDFREGVAGPGSRAKDDKEPAPQAAGDQRAEEAAAEPPPLA
jgi:sec-independent protein translocase protein TatA